MKKGRNEFRKLLKVFCVFLAVLLSLLGAAGEESLPDSDGAGTGGSAINEAVTEEAPAEPAPAPEEKSPAPAAESGAEPAEKEPTAAIRKNRFRSPRPTAPGRRRRKRIPKKPAVRKTRFRGPRPARRKKQNRRKTEYPLKTMKHRKTKNTWTGFSGRTYPARLSCGAAVCTACRCSAGRI